MPRARFLRGAAFFYALTFFLLPAFAHGADRQPWDRDGRTFTVHHTRNKPQERVNTIILYWLPPADHPISTPNSILNSANNLIVWWVQTDKVVPLRDFRFSVFDLPGHFKNMSSRLMHLPAGGTYELDVTGVEGAKRVLWMDEMLSPTTVAGWSHDASGDRTP